MFYITVHVVILNTHAITVALLTTNEGIIAEGLRQAHVAVGTGHSGWAHTLTRDWITEAAGAIASCDERTFHAALWGNGRK